MCIRYSLIKRKKLSGGSNTRGNKVRVKNNASGTNVFIRRLQMSVAIYILMDINLSLVS